MERLSRTPAVALPGLGLGLGLALGAICVCSSASGADRSQAPPGPVVLRHVRSRPDPRAYWTRRRMRAAKPLSLVVGADGRLRRRFGSASRGAALSLAPQGTDSGDPTAFPERANGVLYGSYGPTDYQCSGSVVDTSGGSAVLTAGHCVIDPGPGTRATNLIFVPGYRDGAAPFGEWPATGFLTTGRWQSTAATGNANDADEAGDMAILSLAHRADGATLQSVVGAVGMAFNQPRLQTYSEYGYPAEPPYDGSKLYRLTAPWSVDDASFSPPTMGIVSDFTAGSSGGPWLVGDPPVALSVTDYSYANPLDDHLYGPYFGNIAEQLYAAAGGPITSSASGGQRRLRIKAVIRDPRRGVALLRVGISGAGLVSLAGRGLGRATRSADGAGVVSLPVRPRGGARRRLRWRGALWVDAIVSFTPPGEQTLSKSRRIRLLRGR